MGEWGFQVECETLEEASTLAATLRTQPITGQIAVNRAFRTVGVLFAQTVPDTSEFFAQSARAKEQPIADGRTWIVPVCYELGPDLGEAASELGITPEALIRAHLEARLTVDAIGFSPGFPYCSGLPEILERLPRRAEPRPRVPAGAVAVAAGQAAIYPEATPGGWWLLAQTPLSVIDAEADWLAFRAGDQIQFHRIDRAAFDQLATSGMRLDGWEENRARD